MSSLEAIFSTLDDWRHLLGYQLERRVDIFFAMFLPKVIAKKFDLQESDLCIIPEFPYGKADDSAKHQQVDFAVFSNISKRLTLVELKTDIGSVDPDQLDAMREIRSVKKLICDVIEIVQSARKGSVQKKYTHLVCRLSALGLIDNLDRKNIKWESSRPGIAAAFKEIELGSEICKWEKQLVLISPCNKEMEGFSKIDFSYFAEVIKDCDEMGKTFAKYLREWEGQEAGDRNPWRESTNSGAVG